MSARGLELARQDARRRHEHEQLPALYVHPRPEVPARRATDDELAAGGRTFGAMAGKARAAGWRVVATYARGWSEFRRLVDGHFETTVDRMETMALRMSRDGGRRRAVAVYSRRVNGGKWSFDLAYVWGEDQPISRRGTRDLIAYLIQPPIDHLVEACAA